MQCPRRTAGWLDDSPRAYNTCLTDQRGIPNTPPAAGLANKAITGLIWMFDFNVSQPHLCLKMIICHWGKQTDKHGAFLGRVWHSTSCDSGCLPIVAGEHSYSACWMAGIRYLGSYHSQPHCQRSYVRTREKPSCTEPLWLLCESIRLPVETVIKCKLPNDTQVAFVCLSVLHFVETMTGRQPSCASE